jgi:hypothetical protein
VVNREQATLFLLIFSSAIYVRDAGVAGSNPATPTNYHWLFLIAAGAQVNRRLGKRGVSRRRSWPIAHRDKDLARLRGIGIEVDEAFIKAHPVIEGPCYV